MIFVTKKDLGATNELSLDNIEAILVMDVMTFITVVTLCPGTFAAVFRGFCCPFWRHLHLRIPFQDPVQALLMPKTALYVPRNILQLNIPVLFPRLYRFLVLIPRTIPQLVPFPSFELGNGTRCGIARVAECYELQNGTGR